MILNWQCGAVAIHILLTIPWFALLILATTPLSRFLRRPGVIRGMDRATGLIFVGFGLRLAASKA